MLLIIFMNVGMGYFLYKVVNSDKLQSYLFSGIIVNDTFIKTADSIEIYVKGKNVFPRGDMEDICELIGEDRVLFVIYKNGGKRLYFYDTVNTVKIK